MTKVLKVLDPPRRPRYGMGIMRFNGDILKAERLRQGYSLGELAKRLRLYEPKASKELVFQWENSGQQPSVRYIIALSKAIGKPMEFFLTK